MEMCSSKLNHLETSEVGTPGSCFKKIINEFNWFVCRVEICTVEYRLPILYIRTIEFRTDSELKFLKYRITEKKNMKN